MRRARRTRPGQDFNKVVSRLTDLLAKDEKAIEHIITGHENKAFGRLVNKWLDASRESVLDRYVDEEAYKMTWTAINRIKQS